jgi:hypothetical protein
MDEEEWWTIDVDVSCLGHVVYSDWYPSEARECHYRLRDGPQDDTRGCRTPEAWDRFSLAI